MTSSPANFLATLTEVTYIPKKPVRWGIRIWCLCDSLTGYCLAFNVYTGIEGCVPDDLGYRVVMDLMSDLQTPPRVYGQFSVIQLRW